MIKLHPISLRQLLPVISCFSFYSLSAQNVGIGTTSPQYKLDVRGSAPIVSYVYSTSTTNGTYALYAQHLNAAAVGTAITGSGGYVGVEGIANISGSGDRFGMRGYGGGGVGENIGIHGSGSGGAIAYGIYGLASGATTNWAGYFGSGNVHIQNRLSVGTTNTSLAKLQVQGAVGNTVAMFSNTANSQGLSLISDWPGLYFNAYYNGGAKSMASTGFAADIFADQSLGGIVFRTCSVANTSIGGAVTLNENMRIASNGRVGIGNSNPLHRLDVLSNTINPTGFFENVITGADAYALVGACQNTPGAGIGLGGYGGKIGVYGEATEVGTGSRYGILGYALGGTTAYGIYATASGATTNWAGYFIGATFCSSGVWTGSDRKLKNDIQPLKGAMGIINQLKPTVYSFKTQEYQQMNLPEGLQYGLIADEVQQVMPGAVRKAIQPASYANNDEKKGNKLSDAVEFNTVNYTEMIPLLIGAVKEQNVIIAELKKEIELLKAKTITNN